MNLCVVSKGTFTKEDYMELYNSFKDIYQLGQIIEKALYVRKK